MSMARERILVVEDEREIQELIRYNLVKERYQVTCVGLGEDALRTARNESPDLVLLDLMLPGVDGLEVCRRMKADPVLRPIPIVMVTVSITLSTHFRTIPRRVSIPMETVLAITRILILIMMDIAMIKRSREAQTPMIRQVFHCFMT